jgi:hypothetical protein
LPLPQKQERVRQAELLLAQMRASTSHDTEPSPATTASQAPVQATTHPVVQESKDTSDPCAQSVQFLRGVARQNVAAHGTRSLVVPPDALRGSPPAHAFRTAAVG